MIGGAEVAPADSDGNLVSATYLGVGMVTTQESRDELTIGHAGAFKIFQKNGQLFTMLQTDNSTLLLTAGSKVGQLTMPYRVLSQPGQSPLVVSADPQTVSRLDGTNLSPVEAPECTMAREDNIHAQVDAKAAVIAISWCPPTAPPSVWTTLLRKPIWCLPSTCPMAKC